MLFLQKPRYYDAPDGHAPTDKVISMAKKSVVVAFGAGLVDCIFFTDTRTALQTVNCMAFWTLPAAGLGATWATVTYASTNLRGKDDHWNYAIGALSCYPILHSWTRNIQLSCWTTAILVASAILAKHKYENNWDILPTKIERNWGVFDRDWSLMKEYDKDFRSPYVGGLS